MFSVPETFTIQEDAFIYLKRSSRSRNNSRPMKCLFEQCSSTYLSVKTPKVHAKKFEWSQNGKYLNFRCGENNIILTVNHFSVFHALDRLSQEVLHLPHSITDELKVEHLVNLPNLAKQKRNNESAIRFGVVQTAFMSFEQNSTFYSSSQIVVWK